MKKVFLLLFFAILVLGFAVYELSYSPTVLPVVVNHKLVPAAKIAPLAPAVAPVPAVLPVDPRLGVLEAFLDSHGCLDKGYGGNYLAAADLHHLDWRLLPALSFKEEQCTRNGYMNNLWGWDSGAVKFDSLAAGIDFIAQKLDTGYFYAGKTTEQKLKIYNSHPGYGQSVERIMDQISPLSAD